MPTLRLKSLKCNKTEDFIGADDPYLHVNGDKIWGPIKAKKGDVLIINEHTTIKSKAIIELWEKDIDRDDHLGTHITTVSEVGAGDMHASFVESGADYELTYEVIE